MCGRRKMEQELPDLCEWGDMAFPMVEEIARQIPPGTIIQMHNNGEPMLYPRLGEAMLAFSHCIRQFNTNAKLLIEKADEIIGNLEILTISVIEDDPEGDEQYEIVREFLRIKGDCSPKLVYRLLGKVDKEERWCKLPGKIAKRVLHSPDGSRDYRRSVTIPEVGICLDLLTHLAIDRYGNISLCVRFDPTGELRLDNIDKISLEEAWNGAKRQEYLAKHIGNGRSSCPGCDKCDFWGIPRGD